MYYAQPSWYIRTTQIKDGCCARTRRPTGTPTRSSGAATATGCTTTSTGRCRAAATGARPLPIWRCDEGHQTCVGSLAELSELTGTDLSGLDPHRPYVDAVIFDCSHRPEGPGSAPCGTEAQRVPEVIDAWFDCGSMPFAQWGYPHRPGSAEMLDAAYPADFICEAIDQTRGWFYTLMAVGTLVFDESSYGNVLCLGHILAEDGRKMSKHLGNILEPMPLMDQHGADAVRWFMAASGSPWAARRVGHGTIQETVRKVLLTYWNTVAFQVLYARTSGWTPQDVAPAAGGPAACWTGGRSPRRTGWSAGVTAALEDFDTQRAGRAARGVRRRPVQLVRPPLPPPVLGRRRRRARDAARVPAGRHPADGADHAVHHRAGLAGRLRPDLAGRRRRRCTSPPGPRWTTPWSTTSWARRWR